MASKLHILTRIVRRPLGWWTDEDESSVCQEIDDLLDQRHPGWRENIDPAASSKESQLAERFRRHYIRTLPPNRRDALGIKLESWEIESDYSAAWQFRWGRVLGVSSGAIAAAIGLVICYTAWFGQDTSRNNLAAVTTETSSSPVSKLGQYYTVDAQGHYESPRKIIPGEPVEAPSSHSVFMEILGHELTLQPGTQLVVSQRNDLGISATLALGQIQAKVNRAPAEGEFHLATPHANIKVLGTVFNVASSISDTQLQVLQGRVQVVLESGTSRQVASGHSILTGGQTFKDTSKGSRLTGLLDSLADPIQSLRESDWYQERFAHLIALKSYLVEQGIEVNENTLLALSGDLWCLQYSKHSFAGQAPWIHRKTGLERAAEYYGYQVEWFTPTSSSEAKLLAQQTIDDHGLALAFGWNNKAVNLLSRDNLQSISTLTDWKYRFLGEEDPSGHTICRVVLSARGVDSRDELAREALGDILALLTDDSSDSTYHIGQQAIEEWVTQWSEEGPAISDPFLLSLSALGKLGPACQEFLESQTGPGSSSSTQLSDYDYIALAQNVNKIFTQSAFARTDCLNNKKQRSARRNLIEWAPHISASSTIDE